MVESIEAGWSGSLTPKNREQIAALMQQILDGMIFTYTLSIKAVGGGEMQRSHDYSERTYLLENVRVAKEKIWLSDNFGTLHTSSGSSISFDADGQGFTIQEPWPSGRTIHQYRYRVNTQEEEKQ